MKALLLPLALLMVGCASTKPTGFGAQEEIVSLSLEPIGQRVAYYTLPDSTRRPAGYLTSGNLVYVVARKGRWYRSKVEKGRSHYYLARHLSAPAPPTRDNLGYPISPSRSIQTGPRGGHYYINSNGNKTYIKH